MVYPPEGIAFINLDGTWLKMWIDRLLRRRRWVRVPREREAMHFPIVGDAGAGKSAANRQVLSQVWERGETAIVYDQALEYVCAHRELRLVTTWRELGN